MSPGRLQAIIWTNAGILLNRNWGADFSENLIKIQAFSLPKMHLKCRMENGGHFVSAFVGISLYVTSLLTQLDRPITKPSVEYLHWEIAHQRLDEATCCRLRQVMKVNDWRNSNKLYNNTLEVVDVVLTAVVKANGSLYCVLDWYM